MFADAPAPANVIVDLDEGVGGARQSEGEEKPPPPLIPELNAFGAAPIPTNVMIDLDKETSGAEQGEGEGTLIPPLVPEIVQTNTDIILGISPDPGRDEVQNQTPPPPRKGRG